MSVQALGWVFDHSPTKGSDRLVLLSIANHAGASPTEDAWEAWPGVETIRREAGLDRARTVTDALGRLVAHGHLVRVINGAPDERKRKDQRPNLYRILMDNGVSCDDTRCGWCGVTRDATRGDATRRNGVTRDDATGCRDASPKPSLNRQEEPSVEPLALVAPDDLGPSSSAAFDAFWETYPRKVAKGAARTAWPRAIKAAGPGGVGVIIQGAQRFRDDPNRVDEYTPHPSTWLRGERWNDPPLPPRGTNGKQNGRPAPRPIMEDRSMKSGRIEL